MEPLERLLERLRSDLADRPPSDAVKQGVAPLLHYALIEKALPSSQTIRRAYYETAACNVNRLEALEALSRRCENLVPIKGIDLARRVYPNVATRPMHDVDVWVADGKVSVAEQALESLGYRPAMPEMSKKLTRLVKHARLYVGGPDDSVGLDLHWSLVGNERDRRAPSLSWFRERASTVLEPTAHLLYLAAHMKLQHYDEELPLIWLVDFYLLAHSADIDWRELKEAARRFQWSRALAAVRNEVEGRLELALPKELGPSAPHPHGKPVRVDGERAWNELRTLGMRGRVSLVRAWVLPDPSYLRWRYRDRFRWFWPLYYALRWARIVRGGLGLVWHRCRRERISEPALLQSRPIT